MRLLKKILTWTLLILAAIVTGSALAVYFYKDRIIRQVVNELNKNLQVPVAVEHVDIDPFYGLPYMAIAFDNLVLPSGADKPLIRARKVYVVLNPITVWRGKLEFERLAIKEGEINILFDSRQKGNYEDIFQINKDSGRTSTSLNLRSFVLENITLHYQSQFTGTSQAWQVEHLRSRLSVDSTLVHVSMQSQLALHSISMRQWQGQWQKPHVWQAKLQLAYLPQEEKLIISPSTLQANDATLQIAGSALLGTRPYIELNVKAHGLTIRQVATYFPARIGKQLAPYKSKGNIAFEAQLKGPIEAHRQPALQAQLSFDNVEIYHPTLQARMGDLNFTAHLNMDDIGNPATARLTIEQIMGRLQAQPFEAGLTVYNLQNPSYHFHFKGLVSANWLLALGQNPLAERASGNIALNIQGSGKWLPAAMPEYTLSGTATLQDLQLPLHDTLTVEHINGVVQFDNQQIGLSDLQLQWLKSDITFNGFLNGQLQSGRPLTLQADARAHYLDISDIVALANALNQSGNTDSTALNLQPDLELTCVVDKLVFKRFRGQNISGELHYQNNTLEVIDLTGETLSGSARLNGHLQIQPDKDEIFIEAHALTKNVYLDSLFYVFNNFDQDFIRAKHLGGRLFADVHTKMYFNKDWHLQRNRLFAEGKIRIEKGELNDFEPIMALAPYLTADQENLSRLRFANLDNYITVRHDTVFIPEMSIRTNVRNIALGGYQTLDDHINYQVAVPVITERVDKDEAFGAIKKSSSGMPNLLFVIKGTTSDYKVRYDLKRATGNVLKLLDVTKIFKKKETDELDSTFLEDEEFDWNN